MKKKPDAQDELKVMRVALYVSLALNVLILILLLSFWVVLNNAGTNRYNQATLRFLITYKDRQFCSGKGHEKLMNEIASAATSPEEADKVQASFDSNFCGQ